MRCLVLPGCVNLGFGDGCDVIYQLGFSRGFAEPYCGWLEEPMDLDVFGQSLVDPSSPTIPLDEEAQYISAPSSPLVSFPATPIQPTSPQELYLRVVCISFVGLASNSSLIKHVSFA